MWEGLRRFQSMCGDADKRQAGWLGAGSKWTCLLKGTDLFPGVFDLTGFVLQLASYTL